MVIMATENTMTKPLKTSPKTASRALFLRKRGYFNSKKGRKTSKMPPAVAYRGIICQKKYAVKEPDPETGLYYYGARYLDPKTGRWLSGDPALGEYLPVAPLGDEAKKRNQNLPGMGGVFNYVNLHAYHYAGNNPVKYVDPDGKKSKNRKTAVAIDNLSKGREKEIKYSVILEALEKAGGFKTVSSERASEIARDLKDKGADENGYWMVSVEERTLPPISTREKDSGTILRNGMRDYTDGYTGSPSQYREDDNIYETFNARIYNVQTLEEGENESKAPIIRQYIDLNNDGYIDGELERG
jgi:RHS repeat-associated protein